jgi:hypothetical protein
MSNEEIRSTNCAAVNIARKLRQAIVCHLERIFNFSGYFRTIGITPVEHFNPLRLLYGKLTPNEVRKGGGKSGGMVIQG